MKFLVLLFASWDLYAQCASSSPSLPFVTGPYTLPTAEVGVPFSYQFQATSGQPPYRFFSLNNRPIPGGLTLSESGELSGRPTRLATNEFINIIIRDARGTEFNDCQFQLTVIPNRLAISTTTLPRATVGVPYSTTVSVVFGTAPFRFELERGPYPPGLLGFINGAISGTPTTPGTYTFRFRVVDANGNSASADLSITIDGPGLRFETSSLPAGEVGVPYSSALRLDGSPANATFQLSAGTLPPGLTLSPAGLISGNPSLAGNFNFNIRATTPTASADAPLSIRIAASTQPFTLQAWPASSFTSGLPVNTRIPTIGGQGAVTFTLLDGIIPAGLQISATGEVSGTPRGLPGTYTQRWRATDATNAVSERTYSISIEATRPFPSASLGQPYSQRDPAPGRYTLAPTSRLPLGLALSPDGTIAGNPFAAGDYTFALLFDPGGLGTAPIQTRAYSLSVTPEPGQLELDTLDFPSAAIGLPYRQALISFPAATAIQLFDGALPPGLSIQAGAISGTPTTSGYFEFLLDVRSAAPTGNRSATRRYAISVEPAAGRLFLNAAVNSASYQGPAIVPGQIITLFGTNLDRLSSATIGSRKAHILYATPTQAAVIASHSLVPGTNAGLTLTRGNQETLPLTLRVLSAQPALYTQDGSGSGPAAALNQDASLNSVQNPAPQGSVIVLFGTGLGPLVQPASDGLPAPAANLATVFQSGGLTATVNDTPATILYAGTAPGLITGVDQLNIQLPPNLPPGQARLQLSVPQRPSPEVLIIVR